MVSSKLGANSGPSALESDCDPTSTPIETGEVCEATETVTPDLDVAPMAPIGERTRKANAMKWESLRAWMSLPFFMACAGSPPPTDRMATAEASVRAAREVGAESVPQAELHVKLAQEQITKARKLIDDGDNERAGWMLRRADADAELALALAREASTRNEAQRAIDELRVLQQPGQ